MSEFKAKLHRVYYLVPLLALVADLIIRRNDFGVLSSEDIIIYSLSFVYEIKIFALTIRSLKKYPFLPLTIITLYLIAIFSSYSFYRYFNTLPGINTFSFLYASPENGLEIVRHNFNLLYFSLIITVIALALWGYIKTRSGIVPIRRLPLIGLIAAFILFTLVLNNNTRLKDNRTLPFSNLIFAAEHGYLDYRNNSKIVQIGSRNFSIDEKPLKLTADFNVIFIMNESLSPYYLLEFGANYPTDSLFLGRINRHTDDFFIFRNAYSNSTVTAVSVPFTIAGLNPLQGKNALTRMPLLYDYLKHHYLNVNTSYITSWSYDDYPNYKSFFRSANLDYYLYREKISAPKVVDMGCDDTVITRRFKSFLKANNPGSSFFTILHYSNTHFPHYSPDAVKIYNNDNQLLADYVNSLRYYDRNIDELFKVLKAQNKLDRTIIISTSDHSESVGEHIPERGHFGKYNDWKTRVPMWVYMPPALREKFPSGILLENTQHVVCNNDIVPTLLDIYNLPVSPQIKHGQSLLRTLKKNREIYIYNGPGENRSDSREYFAAVNDTSFYIATKNGDRVDNELFMRDDHYQKNDLFKSTGLNPTPYKRLLRELKIFQ